MTQALIWYIYTGREKYSGVLLAVLLDGCSEGVRYFYIYGVVIKLILVYNCSDKESIAILLCFSE